MVQFWHSRFLIATFVLRLIGLSLGLGFYFAEEQLLLELVTRIMLIRLLVSQM